MSANAKRCRPSPCPSRIGLLWLPHSARSSVRDVDELRILEDRIGRDDRFVGVEARLAEARLHGARDAFVVEVHVGGALQAAELDAGATLVELVGQLRAIQ